MPEHFHPCRAFSCTVRVNAIRTGYMERPLRFSYLRSLACAVSPTRPAALLGHAGYATLKSGGYCGRVPPLPIPNREVKPARADGTAMQCGRVGHRLLYCLPGASGHPGRLFLLLKVANNQKKSYVCNRKMARGFHFGASRPGYLHNLSVKTACGD